MKLASGSLASRLAVLLTLSLLAVLLGCWSGGALGAVGLMAGLLGVAWFGFLLAGGLSGLELGSMDSEPIFAQIFDEAPHALLLVGNDGLIRLANRRAARVLGLRSGELSSRPLGDFLPRTAAADAADAAGTDDRDITIPVGDGELLVRTASGRELALQVSCAVVGDGAGFMVALAPAALSADTHLTGSRLPSNQELVAFVSAATGELTAPLRGIESMVALTIDDVGSSLPPRSRRRLELVQRRSRQLNELVEALVFHARLGAASPAEERVALGPLLADLVELEVPQARFELLLPADLPILLVPSAPVALALRNVLANAVQHHDRPCGRIEVLWHMTDDNLVLSVSDDGPGIVSGRGSPLRGLVAPPRLAAGASAWSGLGLPLVKRAMDVMGGAISIHPASGRGTVVNLTWPGGVVADEWTRVESSRFGPAGISPSVSALVPGKAPGTS